MTAVTEVPVREQTRSGSAGRGGRRRRAPRWRPTLPSRLRIPRAPQTRSTASAVTMWVALSLAGLIAWVALYALVVSALEENHHQGVLYSKLREQLAAATAPVGGAITPGSPVALLTMKSAGLRDVVVVEGTASGDLMKGPGHRRDTVLPGQSGASVLYGRATMFGGPFGDIASASPGDTITLTTGQGVATYTVTGVRRAGDPLPQPLREGGGRLTLVTADGSGWRSGWASNRAVYVDADLKGDPFPAPSGRPTVVPKAETALQGDPSALYTLVFWLPLLGLVAVLVVWIGQVWGRWQTWLVAVPVVLAALWGVSETAVRLLPNLL